MSIFYSLFHIETSSWEWAFDVWELKIWENVVDDYMILNKSKI